MIYLIQTSKILEVKKMTSTDKDIYILSKKKLSINSKVIFRNEIFDFVEISNIIFFCENTGGSLFIYKNNNLNEIKGKFHLNSLKLIDQKKICIGNGLKEDGINLNYVIININENFIESIFFRFEIFLSENFIVNEKIFLKSYLESGRIQWQTDISNFGEIKIDFRGNPVDKNTITGELMGHEDTVVACLQGGQLVGLNIENGSLKWLKEKVGNRLVKQNKAFLYSIYDNIISEIEIASGTIQRTFNLSPFLTQCNDNIFNTDITNGMLVFDFINNYSNIAVFDLGKWELAAHIQNEPGSIMLRVGDGNTIWHKNQLFARDPMSNTLYVYGE